MPLILLGSFFLGIFISWVLLKTKYQRLIEEGLKEATENLTHEITRLETSNKEAQQKIADLEYSLKEREKDIAALKSRDN